MAYTDTTLLSPSNTFTPLTFHPTRSFPMVDALVSFCASRLYHECTSVVVCHRINRWLLLFAVSCHGCLAGGRRLRNELAVCRLSENIPSRIKPALHWFCSLLSYISHCSQLNHNSQLTTGQPQFAAAATAGHPTAITPASPAHSRFTTSVVVCRHPLACIACFYCVCRPPSLIHSPYPTRPLVRSVVSVRHVCLWQRWKR